MKKLLLLLLTCFLCFTGNSQSSPYWQQQVNNFINVSLNDSAKTLDGYIRIQYINHSPDSLSFIWFHVWPNAYKNDLTAFSDQLLENGRTDFYFEGEDKRGYINRLDFKVDKQAATTEDHPQHQDIIKLVLPKPLPPGGETSIETAFHVQLPFNFSRGGYIGQSFQVTQWYPKPAVYDHKGWHEMPYLDQGEFYSEFGNYDVQVSLPESYVVAATGKRVSESVNDSVKTVRFQQESVHDFAWFADKDFAIQHDTLRLPGKTIDVYAYYNKANEKDWKNSLSYIKAAVLTKSAWLGEYPYDIVSIVERPGPNNGGMEYPTITLVGNPHEESELDQVIYHEIGHNWFYGILASNEREHPWMDEGMNSYYDNRYVTTIQQKKEDKPGFIANRMPSGFEPEDMLLETMIRLKKDQPIETRSENFSFLNYGLVAYRKTALWLIKLEAELGQPLFDSVMRTYYERWKFKHPYPEDFRAVAEEVSGRNLEASFAWLNRKGSFPDARKKPIKLSSFFSFKNTMKQDHLFIAPALGYNFYDKFMIGALLHNYTLPVSKCRFVLAPLYATGSKTLNGIGRLSFGFSPGNNGQRVEWAVSGARFTADSFTDSTGTKNYLAFGKLVPSLKYVFGNKSPRSTTEKYIQWKTFLIHETGLRFTRDTVQQIDVITYPVSSRYLNQLRFVIENSRALYPYQAILLGEQGEGFVKLNLTAHYFFNYPKGGGLQARFFAGKFMYTGEKTFLTQFQTDRYHLNMTGANGYEDYTYSTYFSGRNEFEGFRSQQIMNRDGAFKVRTDLLSDKIGKTDDWLTAVNLSTTIPKQLNPLELLPVKIPVRLFADIGTYAEAWKKDASTGRFLFDAGVQVSLFRNLINIYFPLVYSKVYSDYIKSTITEKRFQKNISFSIDIQHFTL